MSKRGPEAVSTLRRSSLRGATVAGDNLRAVARGVSLQKRKLIKFEARG